VAGREGVDGGKNWEVEEEMSAVRRRCFAVAVRAARGGGGWREVAECRIGVRKVGDSVGRPRDEMDEESWERVINGAAIVLEFFLVGESWLRWMWVKFKDNEGKRYWSVSLACEAEEGHQSFETMNKQATSWYWFTSLKH
jgi:hypothetical protein